MLLTANIIMNERFVAFPASNRFSSDTTGAWRHSPKGKGPDPYFLLQDDVNQACGIKCYDPIFGTNLIICQGDKKACSQWIQSQFAKCKEIDFQIDEGLGYGWHHIVNEGEICIIWLSTAKDQEELGAEIIGVLAHEALHCAFTTSKRIGMRVVNESEEFFTYYMQWVMNQYLTCLGHDPQDNVEQNPL